jgi:exosortase E/protease (VPEID-CTERM system)
MEGIAPSGVRSGKVSSFALLLGLLIAEGLALSIRFNHVSADGPWTQLFGPLQWTGMIGHVVVALIAALFVLRGNSLSASLQKVTERFELTPVFWLSLAAHLITAAGVFFLTAIVFEGGSDRAANAIFWVTAWALSGALALVLWLSAAVPLTELPALARGGSRWLFAAAGMAILAVGAGQLVDQLWLPLAKSTFAVVENLLNLVYPVVVTDPGNLVVGTPEYSIQVAPMCSGYEGMGLVLVFMGFFLWIYRGELRFPQCLLLLPIGVAAIWIANAVRIALLIAIGSSFSPSVAEGGFHSQAGWLAFNAITLGLIAVAWNSAYFSRSAARTASDTSTSEYPAAPYLIPFLVLLLAVMVSGAFSSGGFVALYPIRVLAVAGTLACFAGVYHRKKILEWTWSWQAVAIGVVVFAIWVLLEPLSGVDAEATSQHKSALAAMSPALAALWIVFRAIGSVITVPLCEELAFRGFLTRRLIDEGFERVPMGRFTWFSLIVSSVLFGLLHRRWLAGSLAGLLFAVALYRRGRLTDAFVAHATANGLVTCYVLATGNWAAWS